MKFFKLKRPDKLLIQGIKSLTDLSSVLYSDQKNEAKAKAELAFIGEKKMNEVESQLYEYNRDFYSKKESIVDFSFIQSLGKSNNYWLNFHGIHDVKIVENVGKLIGLDRMTIRQILDTTQRPKVEEYDDYLFFSVKSIIKNDEGELNIEQLSFVLGVNCVISFQEEAGDHFEDIRNKLAEGLGSVRKKKTDYLLGQLLDAILDNYFETIDKMNEEIVTIESEALKNPDKTTLFALEAYKRTAQMIKKALGPFKEALLAMMDDHKGLIKKENIKYFRDLSNSASSVIEEIDSTLKTLEGLTNIYFASVSQKMNETMKVLTTVATIFIPLTFIAGVYGMNFDNMPELHHKYGYFMIWGVMILVTIGMLTYFKRKKWL
jgi:magnesium transporter